MSGYRYTGDDAKLAGFARNFTSRVGDGSGSTEEVYHRALKSLLRDAGPRAEVMDVGCGFGRFVNMAKQSAKRVVGLEPDFERFSACAKAHDNGSNVRIFHASSPSYIAVNPQERFDVVILSMVLQHVPTNVCDAVLRDVRHLLNDTGKAMVATTHAYTERFRYEADPTPRPTSEFDAYASDCENQKSGLPVRMFSAQSFADCLTRAGLVILEQKPFTFPRPEHVPQYARSNSLTEDIAKDVAISQYAIVIRA